MSTPSRNRRGHAAFMRLSSSRTASTVSTSLSSMLCVISATKQLPSSPDCSSAVDTTSSNAVQVKCALVEFMLSENGAPGISLNRSCHVRICAQPRCRIVSLMGTMSRVSSAAGMN